MIGIFRTSIPGSSVAGIAAAGRPGALLHGGERNDADWRGGAPPERGLEGLARGRVRRLLRVAPRPDSRRRCRGDRDPHRLLAAVEAVAPRAMAQGEAGSCHLRRLASLREEVALPSGASYCCRIGVNVVFMAAFGIPVTAYTVALVASSHMLSGALRDHAGWGWADAGARRCHARQTRSDRERRRIFGHARLGSDDVERRSRRRAHALGLRLRTDQATALENTPEAGAGQGST